MLSFSVKREGEKHQLIWANSRSYSKTLICTFKGKSVQLQARSDPEGFRKLRFPDYVTMAQGGSKIASPRYRFLPPNTATG